MMVEIKQLSKTFLVRGWAKQIIPAKRTITALDEINLTVKDGEIAAILGPNGAGKSTLLKIICRLVNPDKGILKVSGKIGYVSGDAYGFYPQLSALENLHFFSTLYDLTSGAAEQGIKEYSGLLEISDLTKPFWHYSQGMKQRLSLLRILLLGQEIVVMDEPTKSLDPSAGQKFRQLIRRLSSEYHKTVILATHYLDEAEVVADKIFILCNGRIRYQNERIFCAGMETFDLKDIYSELVNKENEAIS